MSGCVSLRKVLEHCRKPVFRLATTGLRAANGSHGSHSAQARYRAATSTVQSCATLGEHGGCVVATVSKFSRRMRNSRFDPQELIHYG